MVLRLWILDDFVDPVNFPFTSRSIGERGHAILLIWCLFAVKIVSLCTVFSWYSDMSDIPDLTFDSCIIMSCHCCCCSVVVVVLFQLMILLETFYIQTLHNRLLTIRFTISLLLQGTSETSRALCTTRAAQGPQTIIHTSNRRGVSLHHIIASDCKQTVEAKLNNKIR